MKKKKKRKKEEEVKGETLKNVSEIGIEFQREKRERKLKERVTDEKTPFLK